MSIAPITELNDRARDVFRLVVESFIDNGLPVGSRTVSRLPGINLSPASIRNVMQDLEELGLLSHPHTSAGRVPTEGGLRLFVDGMMQAAEPSLEERAVIEGRLERGGPIEEALASATAALSGLSACAGIVLVPKREPVLRQLGFVQLSPDQALAVMVGSDGTVENRVVSLPQGVTPSVLAEVGNYVSARLSGLTLSEAQLRLSEEIRAGEAELDAVAQELIARGLAIWSRDGSERPVLIVRGQANLLDNEAAADLDRVRQLLDELEGKEEIARLLDRARAGKGMKIFIGSENKLFALSGSSVIAAPYRGTDGKVVGVVGVIGPTRLNYARVVPMVDFTAQALSRLMR
ncbi:heat-inducible transcriptional repressor HrcA [Sphingomonas sp. LY54]|uniref:heat-inducible transcriptional repressor HrcA n=1 Tax=Sphingomonadales TaxID=204457 RepID=UPI002ADEF576|nr:MULTISPECIES: heat-inducible transcriptional repressor HrcA [Sphingomonadales]MEA1013777.1 heat-inducible transcriptional repressor HrcA [Sphingosinicella sp. LY1275]WRP29179.1 heat-inducible transcriptional repressor HrcA [Sphingomonas sp. LY54]